MKTNIRKWDNSVGAVIPSETLERAGIHLGDTVSIDVCEGAIILKSLAPAYTLDQLLENSPAESLELTDEDNEWLYGYPASKEVL